MFGHNRINKKNNKAITDKLNMGAAKPEKPKKKKSSAVLFVKTFIVTTIILVVIAFSGGWYYLANWITPPEPPNNNIYDYYIDGVPYKINPTNSGAGNNGAGGEISGVDGEVSDGLKPDFYTFLIFGMDDGNGNTDTIMVASYDAVTSRANIISIPRDTLVNAERPVKKLNAAYAWGTRNHDPGGHEGGVLQFKQEISGIIGFVPQYYISINLRAFVRIIDAVGGIDVYNPYNMVYSDPAQNLYINIPAGPRHLDGENAMKFARFRQWDEHNQIGDLKRIENQHAVVSAFLEKLIRPSSILKVPEFIDIFNEYVQSDLDLSNMGWIAAQLAGIQGTDALATYTLETEGGWVGNGWYEVINKQAAMDLVNSTINPYTTDIPPDDFDIKTTWN